MISCYLFHKTPSNIRNVNANYAILMTDIILDKMVFAYFLQSIK